MINATCLNMCMHSTVQINILFMLHSVHTSYRYDHELRITSKEALQHPYFDQLRYTSTKVTTTTDILSIYFSNNTEV